MLLVIVAVSVHSLGRATSSIPNAPRSVMGQGTNKLLCHVVEKEVDEYSVYLSIRMLSYNFAPDQFDTIDAAS